MSLPPDIRVATREDRPEFLRLWRNYLEAEYAAGGPYPPTPANLQKCRETFDGYCSGTRSGFTLLWTPPGEPSPQGILMFGEPWVPGGLDSDLGRSGILWGVFVEPAHRGSGVGLKLEFAALPLGIEYGFDSVETNVSLANPHGGRMASGFGTRPASTWSWVRLKEVAPRG